jgi:hypothetical protein
LARGWRLAHHLPSVSAVVLFVAGQFAEGEVKEGFALPGFQRRFLRLLNWPVRVDRLWAWLSALLQTTRRLNSSLPGRVRGANILIWSVLLVLTGLNLRAAPYLAAPQTTTNPPPDIQTVTLAWNPSPDPAATGYFLCWGYAAGQCTNRLDVGNVTNTAVAGLSLDVSYWFNVVAYDGAGREAVPSNEVAYRPSAAALPPGPPTVGLAMVQSGGGGRAVQLSFQAQAGTLYEVQATTDFKHWDSILTTNAPVAGLVLIQLHDMSRYPRRFYRVRLLPAGPLPALPTLSVSLSGSGAAGPVLRFSFQGTAGSTYDIQATPDFRQWSVIGTTNCSTSGVLTYDVSATMNQPRQFFRLAIR